MNRDNYDPVKPYKATTDENNVNPPVERNVGQLPVRRLDFNGPLDFTNAPPPGVHAPQAVRAVVAFLPANPLNNNINNIHAPFQAPAQHLPGNNNPNNH
ncbi:MAG: hypothetical protein ACHQAX_00580 [Gammaproteobacteria bacterium]